LEILVADPLDAHGGLELSAAAKLAPGSIYPILTRLERVGWVTSQWVDPPAIAQISRRQRDYRLSPLGAQRARAALADPPLTGAWRWRWRQAPA
jgi:DNA-binding PadR family transcriptional regulator